MSAKDAREWNGKGGRDGQSKDDSEAMNFWWPFEAHTGPPTSLDSLLKGYSKEERVGLGITRALALGNSNWERVFGNEIIGKGVDLIKHCPGVQTDSMVE